MKHISVIILALLLTSCATKDNSDAWGNFEAEETVLSARVTGNILQFFAKEGDTLKAGDLIAVIDTTDLALSRAELQSNLHLLELKRKASEEKLQLSKTEQANLQVEQQRFSRLLAQNAGTQKQLDDINASLSLKEQSLKLSATEIQMAAAEMGMAKTKLEAINVNITKCYIKAPAAGTVLSIYTSENEFVAAGKPIIKLADLQNLKAVFYVSGRQLTSIKTGQEIKLRIDGATGLQHYPAKVSYISAKAEFTPKVIQTREERTKLVYRVEAITQNDGSLKQGMPVEIVF